MCVYLWRREGREREGEVATSSVYLSCHLQSISTSLSEHMCEGGREGEREGGREGERERGREGGREGGRVGDRNEGGCDVWLIHFTYLSLLHTNNTHSPGSTCWVV